MSDSPLVLPVDPELQRLLLAVRDHEMSAQEKWDQRVSFAYGNCALANPKITRAMVEREAAEIFGPRPEGSH